jgi:molybdate transport system substrate-binding protein
VAPAFAGQVFVAIVADFVPPFREVRWTSKRQPASCYRLLWKSLFYNHNGGPFDVLFTPNVERPKLLEEEGSGTTCAAGHLALCSSTPDHIRRRTHAQL